MSKNGAEKREIVDKLAVITTLVCLLPVIFSILVYQDLPERMAIHWGADGAPNGWAPRWVAAFLLPLLLAALNLICHMVTNADPKQQAQSRTLLAFMKWVPAALSLIVTPLTLLIALGREISVSLVALLMVGLLLLVTGNYLPKCRQNHTLGIRLPWTLRDEDNWNRTHRLAGPLCILAGVLFILCGFFPAILWPGAIAAFLLLLTPVVYSFGLSRKRKN